MRSSILDDIEELFASAGRTPKGRRARRAIFQATRAAVVELGIYDASLDTIANRAGMTQAALRHHFATREDLLSQFFVTASQWYREQLGELFSAHSPQPRDKLEQCITWHLVYMEAVDTALWLERSAYWLRDARNRRVRDDYYGWLIGQYAALIESLQPTLNPAERRRRAYAIVTLILGAWITHGRGSAIGVHGNARERRQLIIDTAMDIATQ